MEAALCLLVQRKGIEGWKALGSLEELSLGRLPGHEAPEEIPIPETHSLGVFAGKGTVTASDMVALSWEPSRAQGHGVAWLSRKFLCHSAGFHVIVKLGVCHGGSATSQAGSDLTRTVTDPWDPRPAERIATSLSIP